MKDLDKFISNNPQFISDLLLDGKGTVKDLNSFESIWRFIESGKSKTLSSKKKEIAKAFNNKIIVPKKIQTPDEIKKYI